MCKYVLNQGSLTFSLWGTHLNITIMFASAAPLSHTQIHIYMGSCQMHFAKTYTILYRNISYGRRRTFMKSFRYKEYNNSQLSKNEGMKHMPPYPVFLGIVSAKCHLFQPQVKKSTFSSQHIIFFTDSELSIYFAQNLYLLTIDEKYVLIHIQWLRK